MELLDLYRNNKREAVSLLLKKVENVKYLKIFKNKN
jgi:hypothetical protein